MNASPVPRWSVTMLRLARRPLAPPADITELRRALTIGVDGVSRRIVLPISPAALF